VPAAEGAEEVEVSFRADVCDAVAVAAFEGVKMNLKDNHATAVHPFWLSLVCTPSLIAQSYMILYLSEDLIQMEPVFARDKSVHGLLVLKLFLVVVLQLHFFKENHDTLNLLQLVMNPTSWVDVKGFDPVMKMRSPFRCMFSPVFLAPFPTVVLGCKFALTYWLCQSSVSILLAAESAFSVVLSSLAIIFVTSLGELMWKVYSSIFHIQPIDSFKFVAWSQEVRKSNEGCWWFQPFRCFCSTSATRHRNCAFGNFMRWLILLVLYARQVFLIGFALDTSILPVAREVCDDWKTIYQRNSNSTASSPSSNLESMNRWVVRLVIAADPSHTLEKRADPALGGFCTDEYDLMEISDAVALLSQHQVLVLGALGVIVSLILLPGLIYQLHTPDATPGAPEDAQVTVTAEQAYEKAQEADAAARRSSSNAGRAMEAAQAAAAAEGKLLKRVEQLEKALSASVAREQQRVQDFQKRECTWRERADTRIGALENANQQALANLEHKVKMAHNAVVERLGVLHKQVQTIMEKLPQAQPGAAEGDGKDKATPSAAEAQDMLVRGPEVGAAATEMEARRKTEQEQEAKRKAEAEEALQEYERKRKAEEDEQEEKRKVEEEEEAQGRKVEEQQEKMRKLEEEEAAKRKVLEEQEARRKQEEEAAKRKALEEQEARRQQEEGEAGERKALEEQEARRKQEEEEAAKLKALEEQEARRKQEEEEEAAKHKALEDQEERRKQEEEAAKVEAASGKGEAASPVTWEVIGGSDKGGIVVRESQDLKSPELPRLSCGAVVEELERNGNRLRYQRISGDGPDEGWVNIMLKDKELLQKRS